MSSKNTTLVAYRSIISSCKKIFVEKMNDYGAAWRILRLSSITDQIFIKAQRIRTIQEKGRQKVEEDIAGELKGIINYCVMALICINTKGSTNTEATVEELTPEYDKAVEETLRLLQNKNHDYDEAWRGMRVSSIIDIVLMKLLRIKQIENNRGKTRVSEGVKANYQDILNYAIFALIKDKQEQSGRLS